MSFVAKELEKAKNEFISVNEAVHLVAKHGECTPIQAATFLLHHNADKELVGYSIDRVFKLHELEWFADRYQAIWSDLDDFVELNNTTPRFDDEGNILEIGMNHGWKRSEFFAFSDFNLCIRLDPLPQKPQRPPPCPPPKTIHNSLTDLASSDTNEITQDQTSQLADIFNPATVLMASPEKLEVMAKAALHSSELSKLQQEIAQLKQKLSTSEENEQKFKTELAAIISNENKLKQQVIIETEEMEARKSAIEQERDKWKACAEELIAILKPCDDSEIEAASPIRARQINFIIATAKAMKFDPLAIPDGGKVSIQTTCLTIPSLFTDASFGHAWKAAKDYIRMANHDIFSKRE